MAFVSCGGTRSPVPSLGKLSVIVTPAWLRFFHLALRLDLTRSRFRHLRCTALCAAEFVSCVASIAARLPLASVTAWFAPENIDPLLLDAPLAVGKHH